MEKPSPENKPRLSIWTTAIVAGTIITAAIIFLLRSHNTETPAKAWFNDPKNDTILNVGTGCPGMIGVTNRSIGLGTVLLIDNNMRTLILQLERASYLRWDDREYPSTYTHALDKHQCIRRSLHKCPSQLQR